MSDSVFIDKGKVYGEITAYPSKSQIQRALLLGLLNRNGIEITNYASSSDSDTVLNSVKRLGCGFSYFGRSFKIKGPDKLINTDIYCNESGLCLRLFAPVLSLSGDEFSILGKESLLKRGNEHIREGLKQLGADCIIGKNRLNVKGPLSGGKIIIDNPSSSQFISGLLFALSKVEGDSEILIKNPVSFPYIEMTARLLNQFGADIKLDGGRRIAIKGQREFISGNVEIEGDWSSAAFLLVAGATAGEVTVSGLDSESLQADREIVSYLEKAGAAVSRGRSSVSVKRSELKGITADIQDHPDLFVPLVILGINADGETRIYNYERLKDKESDRPSVLISELKKAGAEVEIKKNFVSVNKSRLEFSELDPHNDHRLAMGFAVAALSSERGLIINNPGCVNKSYPLFYEELKALTAEA
jgi:3-phosphoshikimate 1-carboxyvinyltransferase